MTFEQSAAYLIALYKEATGQYPSIQIQNTADFTTVGTTLLQGGVDPIIGALGQVLDRTILGNAWTVMLQTERDHFFRREVIMVHLLWRCLRDIVVLTVQTAEVTACAGDGQAGGTRMEMVERLLLHRVDGQGARLAINLTHKHTAIIPPTATDTRLTFSDVTVMRTERTLHSSTFQMLIIPTFYHLQIFLRQRITRISRIWLRILFIYILFAYNNS